MVLCLTFSITPQSIPSPLLDIKFFLKSKGVKISNLIFIALCLFQAQYEFCYKALVEFIDSKGLENL